MKKKLLKGIRAANQKSFGYLIQLYFNPITLYAKALFWMLNLAKEIVQDVFLKIWDNRDSLEIKSSLKSYIYQMTHNLCIDHLRTEPIKKT